MSDVHALSGAYAIDAVDDIERSQFEKHLASCAECQREVAELRATGDLVAGTCEASPPPGLRDKVLAEIQHVRPLPPETTAVVPTERTTGATHRANTRWKGLLTVAATIAALAAGGTIYAQQNDSSPGSPLTPIEKVLQAEDAQTAEVALEGGGTATLVRSESMQQAVLAVDDLPAPPEGKTHQLWLIRPDGTPVSAGLLETEETALLEGDVVSAVAAAISIEPDGGSPQPTTTPIAVVEFADRPA